MPAHLAAYAAGLVAFLAIDAVWLGIVARGFYRDQLGGLLANQPNFAIAALFYLFYAAAIVILAVSPALKSGSAMQAVMLGAVLGLAAYGTYDITNMATLKGWPVLMSIVDMAWGTVLTGTVAWIAFQAGRMAG